MSTRLIVDNTSQLHELEERSQPMQVIAKIISYLFHPVCVPIYIILFLLYIHPTIFNGFSAWEKTVVLLQAIVPYVLFPVVTILLLRGLNFISSFYLVTRKDRIIPYVACQLWYFWIWNVWRNISGYPRAVPKELIVLALAIFLASVIGFLANIYIKISMHAMAMGLMVSFLIMLAVRESTNFGIYLSFAFLIAGLVCTARFICSDHSKKEIYGGLFAGILSLVIAAFFV
jgi:hypothetical protein